jgi:hypothetical protein
MVRRAMLVSIFSCEVWSVGVWMCHVRPCVVTMCLSVSFGGGGLLNFTHLVCVVCQFCTIACHVRKELPHPRCIFWVWNPKFKPEKDINLSFVCWSLFMSFASPLLRFWHAHDSFDLRRHDHTSHYSNSSCLR